MDFYPEPILQICIQIMMSLRQVHQFLAKKWLNEQENHLFILISKSLLSQVANTLSQNRDMRSLEEALVQRTLLWIVGTSNVQFQANFFIFSDFCFWLTDFRGLCKMLLWVACWESLLQDKSDEANNGQQ